jgi:hypothetical protein
VIQTHVANSNSFHRPSLTTTDRISATTHGRFTVIGLRRKKIDLDKLTYALLRILEQQGNDTKRKAKRKRAA